MNWKLEEFGRMREFADADKANFAESQWHALSRYAESVKEKVRDDVRQSGVKNAKRLAGAWRGQIFPKRPQAHANRPAYLLGNNAPNVLDTFERGGTISARGGALLIPIGRARTIKLRIGQPKTDLIREVKSRYGQTLVSQKLKKTGQLALGVFTVTGEAKRRFVPLFILRKSVNAPQIFRGAQIIEQMTGGAAQSRIASETFREFDRRLLKAGRDAWFTSVLNGEDLETNRAAFNSAQGQALRDTFR